MRRLAAVIIAVGGLLAGCAPTRAPLRVGSKAFTESVVLGEILCQSLERAGVACHHRPQLGGSRVLFEALGAGEIDAYVEYTGTLAQELLRRVAPRTEDLRQELERRGIRLGPRLGFENTYALGMLRSRAAELNVESVSDLSRHGTLDYAISHELLARQDGFGGLQRRYQLTPGSLRAVEHSLAYRAVSSGAADVIDVYTTDPEIVRRDLVVLRDDRQYFPEYAAVVLMRESALAAHPGAERAVAALAGSLSTGAMTSLNAQASRSEHSAVEVAAAWLGTHAEGTSPGWPKRVAQRTGQHLVLVGGSLLAALLTALPLGVLCARRPAVGRVVLGVSGVLQTVPSLALLVLLIPLLGIGTAPAMGALFMYSLLPIVQNTYAGLKGIDVRLLESATVIGLSPRQRLWWVELPLSLPMLVAGVKTAAVINVGTATLGALVGAGGYGQPILTGIRLDDMGRVAEGAVPASLLALCAQLGFDLLERALTPRGLRIAAVR